MTLRAPGPSGARQRAAAGPISRKTSSGAGAIARTTLHDPGRLEEVLAEALPRCDRPRVLAVTDVVPVLLLDLFDLLLAQPEVVADLVDERLADRHDEVVFVLGVALVRTLEEQDAIGQRVAVVPRRSVSGVPW